MLTNGFDGAGRVNQVSGLKAGASKTYLSAGTYAPHGAFASYVYGNNLARTYTYNSRLQPKELKDMPVGATNWLLDQQLWWGDTDTQNNGNVAGWLIQTQDTSTAPQWNYWESFTYDAVNRVQSADDNGGWSRSFGYDPYGNMWVSAYTGIAPNGSMPTSNVYGAATNRINGGSYDAAGNQTVVTGTTLTYDAESRVKTAVQGGIGAETFSYDGEGRRVQKSISGGATTTFVYDAMGQLAAKYTSGGSTTPPCQTCYISWDHLGSTRMVTDQSGNVVARHDYLPFGEEVLAGQATRQAKWGVNDAVVQKFTAKERDSESGLDYFGARYYGSALGRFTSPDESRVES